VAVAYPRASLASASQGRSGSRGFFRVHSSPVFPPLEPQRPWRNLTLGFRVSSPRDPVSSPARAATSRVFPIHPSSVAALALFFVDSTNDARSQPRRTNRLARIAQEASKRIGRPKTRPRFAGLRRAARRCVTSLTFGRFSLELGPPSRQVEEPWATTEFRLSERGRS